ncbi:ATP-binding protein [Paracoccus halophilus]|uniref:ATP-binding protein n=1 Tax=Paracoccus halophilus TaxID=376733 RepID=UPI003CC83719
MLRLRERELVERERRMIERRIKAARFPATKSLDNFDLKAIRSLNTALTMELARCKFIDRRESVIALESSGTDKTYVSLGLGLAACQKGLQVRFTAASALVLRTCRGHRRTPPAAPAKIPRNPGSADHR